MPLAIIHSRAKLGVEAPPVTVEVHTSNGLPSFTLVGLPETAVRESKDRVRSALLNSRFEFPARRITVNLAPAELPKEGGRFDLPIAIGILIASGQLPPDCAKNLEFIGELSLSGELRAVAASLPAAIAVTQSGRELILPAASAAQAALANPEALRPAHHLLEICAHLLGEESLPRASTPPAHSAEIYPELAEVKGQSAAKRALEICAAGGHNLLLSGPPGTGKTLLASRLPGLLPELPAAQWLETAAVQSLFDGAETYSPHRPFRAPHHTASAAALVGGGNPPGPGEISRAHNGVLFLDEIAEFPRKVLDVLREPLESGEIHISRARHQLRFPAHFQLVAAMNPCPCGYDGDPEIACQCTPDQIARYRSRLSGPLLDRIDLRLNVPRLAPGVLAALPGGESTAIVRDRVLKAHESQLLRQGCSNAKLNNSDVDKHCALDDQATALLSRAETRLQLSARAHFRIRKVARSIADLSGDANIGESHIAEALSYRQ